MKLSSVLVLVAVAALVVASPSYTGYSNAPGTDGACASKCHGPTTGSIEVSGFPANYVAGQTYEITVSHSGGAAINNFNASVRIGSGSQTAGLITAGTGTEVYNVSGEPNGVHFATANHSSGTFNWTAPNPPVGDVKLYLAGHQGTSSNGDNSAIVVTSQGAAVEEPGNRTRPGLTFTVEPTVVRTALVLRAGNLAQAASVRVIDRAGRCVARIPIRAGQDLAVSWPLLDRDGRHLSSGVYHAVIATGGTLLARRFVVNRN